MTHSLPDLPYATDALSPYIGKETLEYHWGKHHRGYVTKLNALIAGTDFEHADLETIVRESQGPLFNNAAQAWNHNLYWRCLSPTLHQTPHGDLLDAINKEFTSFDNFKVLFTEAGLQTFGSGWVWLTQKLDGSLAISSTPNAENPLSQNLGKPLLGCDVWEHAYYLDTQNDRGKYLDHFFALTNWEFVHEQLRS